MKTETEFLGNIKLIFEHGVRCSKNKSRLMRLLAIHELHYVVEQILRERVSQDNTSDLTHQDKFNTILNKLNKKKNIPNQDSLLLLNEDRNRAEHANKIASYEEIQHYVMTVRNFLIWSYKNYFDSDFDSIMLEDQIIDKPIRRVMKLSRNFINEGDLKSASLRMYPVFSSICFETWKSERYLNIINLNAPSPSLSIDLANILFNLAFKIICADDTNALRKLETVTTNYYLEQDKVMVKSNYPTPEFKDKEEAENEHEDILNIILTFQDRIPSEAWRHTDPGHEEIGT